MTRVAINGLGRIGRAVFKLILDEQELELIAVNDLVPVDNLAYLVKYDSVYGKYEKKVESDQNSLIVDGKEYKVFSEKDPEQLPWDSLGIDIVFECTGIFTKKEGLEKHLNAGAKYAILSAPSKSEDVTTVVYGVNQIPNSAPIFSCASCTTNCITPIVEIMGRRIGVKKAIMSTVHAYTSSQQIVDAPSKKFRRGRAGAANLVPTSTGAAIATTKVLPEFENKFDGVAVRAPIPVGSIADVIFVTQRQTTVEEINSIFKKEAQSDRYKNILEVSEEEIVSSDIVGDSHASIVDLTMTQVVDGDLVKVMSWYDNEWGYANQMVRTAVSLTKNLKQ
ncbi:type I glyceraldehyde-3-phosphate dehydrogenase [Aetokthonos hydrillicola Thurmond2011]|jgi:glyceraldehyde 3-phosphate dehydrogenase|uniref:Glyceraldehyde-3-phosphate dehydrogenase n=1 Tax=Aetokthonos hydrillicola Thurmond2011 TaxID=2712845 RepID=A0AAP5MBZ9_9CYAN|nr:type I glyceraldehyde-3-phosphate dehydrogenase [Aetokthonos hydrillicola]MBO3461581.1 type I glyceraldehyde-3-phosphate dehydrogenase [Aetokthonos hydrillicola CCALA 1050]MBW4586117.1 type I glyceraldehyde-3-phosphate dehydrogenase [Aetokthonos hydrillicola CCALA 1050]MDR9897723.1 type I glyceraldehyde-3-phosphate dehydrogenase [Aetokthonos hydrillicola Thurmond2011]